MISRIRIIKPTIPPPEPYFQALPWTVVVETSSAIARVKRANCRNKAKAACIIAVTVISLGIQEECSVDEIGRAHV